MKRGTWLAATSLSLLFSLVSTQAHDPNRGTAEITLKGAKIEVEYGRPALKGRDMLGRAQVGMVWRLGMDQATTIKTEADMHLGGVKIPQGHYTLYAKNVGPNQWELLVHDQVGLFGTSGRDESKLIASIPLRTEQLEESVEKFTIALKETDQDKGELWMAWGNVALVAELEVP